MAKKSITDCGVRHLPALRGQAAKVEVPAEGQLRSGGTLPSSRSSLGVSVTPLMIALSVLVVRSDLNFLIGLPRLTSGGNFIVLVFVCMYSLRF